MRNAFTTNDNHIGKSRQYTNREKTPKWLDDKIDKQSQESHDKDAKLK